MRKLLEEEDMQIPDGLPPLHRSLKQLLDAGVKEVDGCFFLRGSSWEEQDVQMALARGEDRTGLECSVNNVYIQSVIDNDPANALIDGSEVLKQGIHYAYDMAKWLAHLGEFQVILSYSGYDAQEIMSCSVRFHRNRSDEPAWLDENLENYQEEAVLVF